MKKIRQYIYIFSLALSPCLLQAQEVHTSYYDVLRKQITELKEQQNFITKSTCPQRKEEIKRYQDNFKKLLEVLHTALIICKTPSKIEEDRIKEKNEKSIVYQSSNIGNLLVKRYGIRISMAGIVSDNSTIPVGARIFTETFQLGDKKIEARYRRRKNFNHLITLQAVYPDKTEVNIDLSTMPQSGFRVYNTNEFGTENRNLFIISDPNDIGRIHFIQTDHYELYREKYLEDIKDIPYQKLVKYRYAIHCYDDKKDIITPTKKGNDIEIKPTTYLLWYNGFIGKYPITLMLKRKFNKEQQNLEIVEVAYAYNSKKKWIYLTDFTEPQAGIFASEVNEKIVTLKTAEWHVEFESNSILKGTWNQKGKILPITLTPMAKEFPQVTFKVQIEEKLTPSGAVSAKLVQGLKVVDKDKIIQVFNYEYPEDIGYFKIGYVDINYDGYLDLIVNYRFFLYNSTTKTFDVYTGEEENFSYLDELPQYNPYTKSFTDQMSRSIVEYRTINGKFSPYKSDYYYTNEDGEMVLVSQEFTNGKWKTINEHVERMEEEAIAEVVDDEVDVFSSENYALEIDLTIYDKNLFFSPDFHEKTGLDVTFKKKAKLYVELIDKNKKVHEQYLYDTDINNHVDDKLMLDDSGIIYNGKEYFLRQGYGLIPFFPAHTENGEYTFRLRIDNPVFGKIYANEVSISLPLQIEKKPNSFHFKGTINNQVNGDMYFIVEDTTIYGTFINAKTGKNIHVKGTYTSGFFGVDTISLKEYEKENQLSGFFEGTLTNLKGKNKDVYKGYWISPNKKIRVPFTFKKE